MAYIPKVMQASVVSRNEKNGLFEVVAVLQDRTQCRLVYETRENGEIVATHVSRLHRDPCPICKRDYICVCMSRYLDDIAEQTTEIIDKKENEPRQT